jgi:hypothetical protein
MLINKSIETENGTVKFQGELEQEELDFILKIGLNTLLQMGAIPFTSKYTETDIASGKSEHVQ